MTVQSSRLPSILMVITLLIVTVRCPSAALADPPWDSWTEENLPKFSDDEIYQHYIVRSPNVADDTDAVPRADSPLPQRGFWAEVMRRADSRWSDFALSDRAAALSSLRDFSDGKLFLLLRGVPRKVGDKDAQQRVDAATSEAVRRGGRLLQYAMAMCPASTIHMLDDVSLARQLHGSFDFKLNFPDGSGRFEPLLCEILRRGGLPWESILTREAKYVSRFDNDPHLPNPPQMLEILTALRRLQKRADPIQIVIQGPRKVESVFPDLPVFEVALENRDVERLPVYINPGGASSSCRNEKFTATVIDSNGADVSAREWPNKIHRGGSHEKALEFGEKSVWTLPLRDYFEPLKPGDYSLRLFYHDKVRIADRGAGLVGLICSQSELVTLTIKPCPIRLSPALRQEISARLAQIDEKEPLKIVAGTYGKWAYEVVPPQSPQGMLLAAGPASIPILLDELDKPLSPDRRALILSLLYSLTDSNDPRETPRILPPYYAVLGRWKTEGNGGSDFSHGVERIESGVINVAAQEKFAIRWKPWRSYFVVDEK